jgi:hypothetical protein
MLHAETVDGKIKIQCGKASGTDLICEAAALVTSVVRTLCADEDNPDVYDEELARTAFRCIVTGAGGEVEERTGIDVFAPLSNDADNDEDEDDSDGKIIAKAIPIDSETGRKLLELLGIDPDEAKSGDDETEDDIHDFLF